MGDTMYSSQVLVVHAVSDYDEYFDLDMTLQEDCFRSALRQFSSIHVSRAVDERFRSFVVNCSSDTTSVTLYDGQIPSLPSDVTLLVHWGGYWRTHSDESAILDIF